MALVAGAACAVAVAVPATEMKYPSALQSAGGPWIRRRRLHVHFDLDNTVVFLHSNKNLLHISNNIHKVVLVLHHYKLILHL